ncbi:MAG TPA: hypothetical protein VIY48_15280 [Candidatus Paceibacterota bacterium]
MNSPGWQAVQQGFNQAPRGDTNLPPAPIPGPEVAHQQPDFTSLLSMPGLGFARQLFGGPYGSMNQNNGPPPIQTAIGRAGQLGMPGLGNVIGFSRKPNGY